MRVLIIGAGCTGGVAAVQLRELLPDASIQVWEKARGAGGRYTTSRETVAGRELRADLGAQYASVDPKHADSVAFMESLVKAGAAKLASKRELAAIDERPINWQHYQGTAGQNGLVKAMMKMAGADVAFERRVSKIDKKGSFWSVTSYDGTCKDFDCVLLCVPGCGRGGDNLNKIGGGWTNQLSSSDWRNVEAPHDARFAVALYLRPGQSRALSAFFGEAVEQRAEGDSIELLIWQSWKNGDPEDGPQVVVAHTWQDVRGSRQSMTRPMVSEACRLLRISPGAVASNKMITWFQSQVKTARAPRPCLVASRSPPLLLAGDYFDSSTFTGCYKSAAAAAQEAAELLGGGSPKPRASAAPPAKRPLAAVDSEPGPSGGGTSRRVSVTEDADEAAKRRKRAERFGMADSALGA